MLKPRWDAQGSARRPAFTLIELTLVVAVIALLASVAIVRGGSALVNSRMRMAAERVAADMALARDRAIATGASYRVVFEKLSYQIGSVAAFESGQAGPPINLADEPYRVENVEVDFEGGTVVTFDPYGAASAEGGVTIAIPPLERKVRLDKLTGRATIE